MTKTYTLRERSSGPSNVTAVAVPLRANGSAGALAIGTTFYYKQMCDGYSDFYDDLNAWVSAVSNEASATTDASNRVIWIHGDNDVSGAEDVITIRTTTSGDYKQTDSSGVVQRHFPRVLGYRSNHYMGVRTNDTSAYDRYEMTTSAIASLVAGEKLTGATSGATALVVTDPAGGTTFKVWTITGTFQAGETLNASVSGSSVGTFSSLSAKDGIVIEDFDSASAYIFPVFDDGLPCLQAESDDPDDPVTPQDVYEWFIDQGKSNYCDGISLFQDDDYMTTNGKNLCNFFRWRFSIYTRNFKIPGGTVVSQALAKHMFRNGEFTMGEYDETNDVTSNGAGLIGAWHLAYYNTLSRSSGSQIKIYGSIMGMVTPNSGSCNRDPYYQITYGPTIIRDSVIKSSGRWNPSLDVKNSRLMIKGEIGNSSDANTNVTENVSWNAYMGGSYNIQEVTFKDSIIKYSSSYIFFMDSYYIYGGCRCININDMIWDYSQFTYLARLRHAGSGSDNMLRISNSLKIKVVDKDGNAIEDAKIYATDVDGEKGLFDKDWVARTYTNLGKTGTSMTLHSGIVTVGKYYRAGDEVIKIVSGSGPYTIARAQNNSTANNIGGASSARMSYLYELNDYLETDSNGEAEMLLNYKYYKSLDGTSSGFYIVESDLSTRGPYNIIIEKQGYETYTMVYDPVEKKDMVIELKDAIDIMPILGKGMAIRADPTNSTKDRDLLL